jgi:tRNA/rRNA methyltransferase
MNSDTRVKNVFVVLSRPLIPENVGAAARAVSNMGLGGVVVVAPENADEERMLKLATHKAAHHVRDMKVYADLKEAVADFGYIVGATARTGGVRRPILFPREAAQKALLHAEHNKVALVFGSEDRGLTNEEIQLCHQLVQIPTAEFSSLNLAQAVMILSYEVFLAAFNPQEKAVPRLASSRELELMYERAKETLIKISFIEPNNPDHWMLNIRRFCNRIGLRSDEVNMLMGICRQIDWYGEACRQGKKLSCGSGRKGK